MTLADFRFAQRAVFDPHLHHLTNILTSRNDEMATGFDGLIQFLLEEIALAGPQGALISDISKFTTQYYAPTRDVSHQETSTLEIGFHESSIHQTVDRPFQEQVWKWLSKNPEVRIGENGEGNAMSLSEVEAYNSTVEATIPDAPTIDPNSAQSGKSETYVDNATLTVDRSPSKNEISHSTAPVTTSNALLRVYTSQLKLWQAVVGHDPDFEKVSVLEFACLAVMALYREKGIVQSDLVRLTGQDKRSVPHRTQKLVEKGYMVKIPVMFESSRTNTCILKRFASTDARAGKTSHLLPPLNNLELRESQGALTLGLGGRFGEIEDSIRDMLQSLKELRIIRWNDLKRKLGIYSNHRSSKILATTVRRLESLGCLQRVKAQGNNSRPSSQYFRSIKLIREPDQQDWDAFLLINDRVKEKLWLVNDQNLSVDSDIDEEDDGCCQADDSMQLDITKFSGVQPNNETSQQTFLTWRPDIPFVNILHQSVLQGGVRGLSINDIGMNTVGNFYVKPLVHQLARLAEVWQLSQPLHLRHLAIIRDSRMAGKNGYFVHYTYDHFQFLVDNDKASWEAVQTIKDEGKPRQPSKLSVGAVHDVDEHGFPKLNHSLFVGGHGNATLKACLQAVKIRKFTVTSNDPHAVRSHDNTYRVSWTALGDSPIRRPGTYRHPVSRKPQDDNTEQPRRPIGRPRKYPREGLPPDAIHMSPKQLKLIAISQDQARNYERKKSLKAATNNLLQSSRSPTFAENEGTQVSKFSTSKKQQFEKSRVLEKSLDYLPSTVAHTLPTPDYSFEGKSMVESFPSTDSLLEKSQFLLDLANAPYRANAQVLLTTVANLGKRKANDQATDQPRKRRGRPPQVITHRPESCQDDGTGGVVSRKRQADDQGHDQPRKRRGRPPKGDVRRLQPLYVDDYLPSTSEQLLTQQLNGETAALLPIKAHKSLTSVTCSSPLGLTSQDSPSEVRKRTAKAATNADKSEARNSSEKYKVAVQYTNRRTMTYNEQANAIYRPNYGISFGETVGLRAVGHRGRPPRSRLMIIKTSYLKSLEWFIPKTQELSLVAPSSNLTELMADQPPMISQSNHSISIASRSITPSSAMFQTIPVGSRASPLSPANVAGMNRKRRDSLNLSSEDRFDNQEDIQTDWQYLGGNPATSDSTYVAALADSAIPSIASAIESEHYNIDPALFITANPLQGGLSLGTTITTDIQPSDISQHDRTATLDPLQEDSHLEGVIPQKSDLSTKVSGGPILRRLLPTGGSTAVLRRQIVLEIIEKCNGVFPGDKEILFPFTMAWVARAEKSRPDLRTVRGAISSLTESGKLCQLQFNYTNKLGANQTKIMLMLPGILSNDPRVTEMQQKIAMADPAHYVPEGAKVAPRLKQNERLEQRRDGGYQIELDMKVDLQYQPGDVRKWSSVRQQSREKKAAEKQQKIAEKQQKKVENRQLKLDLKQQRQVRKDAHASKRSMYNLTATRTVQPFGPRLMKLVTKPASCTAASLIPTDQPLFNAYGEGHQRQWGVNTISQQSNLPRAQLRFMDTLGLHTNFDRTPSLTPEPEESLTEDNVPSFIDPMLGLLDPPGNGDRLDRLPGRRKIASRKPRHVKQAASARETFLSASRRRMFFLLNPIHCFHASTGTFSVEYHPQTSSEIFPQIRERPVPNESATPKARGGLKPPRAQKRVIRDLTLKEIDDAERWELENHDVQHMKPKKLEFINYRFHRHHVVPEDARWNEVVFEPPKSTTSLMQPPLIRRKRKPPSFVPKIGRLASFSAKQESQESLLHKDEAEEADCRKRKGIRVRGPQRNFLLSANEDRRIMVAIIITQILVGGVELNIDWSLLSEVVLDGKYSEKFIRQRWVWLLGKHRSLIDRMRINFPDQFLQAYQDERIPMLDFSAYDQWNWSWLLDWSVENLDEPIDIPPDLPSSRKVLDEHYELLAEQQDNKNDFFELGSAVPVPRRSYVIHTDPYVIPLLNPSVKLADENHLSVARSWIRAKFITSESTYDNERARAKLDSLDKATVEAALKQLVDSRILIRFNKVRPLPRRIFDISDHFLNRLRKNIQILHFRQATAYKEHLDEVFQRDGVEEFNYNASNGDVMAVHNLAAQGRIRLRPKNPPMEKFGLTEGYSYITRFMDKSRLHFAIEISPTESYVGRNPLNPLPPPPYPPSLSEPSVDLIKLPVWIDIHDKIVPIMWDLALAAVLGIIAIRPGVSAKEISQVLQPSMEAWEVQLVMSWCIEAGAAEYTSAGGGGVVVWGEVGQGGIMVKEWWWLALGPGKGEKQEKRRDDEVVVDVEQLAASGREELGDLQPRAMSEAS